jgi:DNA-binding response OmpR family regulator
MRLLLVEDSLPLALALERGLTEEGFVVDTCGDGQTALELATAHPYVGLVLDRVLPKLDGLVVCRHLRAMGSEIPILMLTARDTIDDRVDGLDAGADDYLVKPFAFPELAARLRAVTRRRTTQRTSVLEAGPVTLDLATGAVRCSNNDIALSAKELALLTALMRHPGRLSTHAQLVEQAWTHDAYPNPEVVRAHVKNLRRKLSAAGADRLIETVYGLGYRVVG